MRRVGARRPRPAASRDGGCAQRQSDAVRVHVSPRCESLPPALAHCVVAALVRVVPAGPQRARTPAAAAAARAFAFSVRAQLTPIQARMRSVQCKAVVIERCAAGPWRPELV